VTSVMETGQVAGGCTINDGWVVNQMHRQRHGCSPDNRQACGQYGGWHMMVPGPTVYRGADCVSPCPSRIIAASK
jgi:hypothetical protein